MSRDVGKCVFPDGTIKFFLFNNTTDSIIPRLLDTQEELSVFWDMFVGYRHALTDETNYHQFMDFAFCIGQTAIEPQPVELFLVYWPATRWSAEACLKSMQIVLPVAGLNATDERHPFDQ